MQKKVSRCTLSGILFTSVLGTLSHFLYEWSGNNLYVGLFTPVNESVWEHMKLLFFPMLLYFLFERLMLEDYPPALSCAGALSLLTGTFLIPVIYYTYTGILGFHLTALDIATFYISVIAAFFLRRHLAAHRKKTGKTRCLWLTAAVLLVFVCFLVFTLCPPGIGLFQIPDALVQQIKLLRFLPLPHAAAGSPTLPQC